jgi:hypothetical protein
LTTDCVSNNSFKHKIFFKLKNPPFTPYFISPVNLGTGINGVMPGKGKPLGNSRQPMEKLTCSLATIDLDF